MKIKNYLIILVMNLLMNQVSALEKMSENDQVHVPSQVGKNEEFRPYSTDQYIYAISSVEQPTKLDIVIRPKVISDVIANNYLNSGKIRTLVTQITNNGKIITTTETWKTKHPSYFTWSNGALVVGAVGAVALTYLVMKEMTQKNDHAFVWGDNLSEDLLKKRLGIDEFENYKKWLLANHELEVSQETYSKYNKWISAAHESGHALEMFLIDPAKWALKATVKEDEINLSHVISVKLRGHELFPASLKNDIKADLAGGIGISVIKGEKLNFEDFLLKESYGIGARDDIGTDMHHVYKQAEKHFEYMNFSIGSWIPKDYTEQEREQVMVDLLKECYEETYQDISSHKDELSKMTDALYEKETIYPNKIYTIASGKTQKFFGLMSSNEQWKKYLTDIFSHEFKSIFNFNEQNQYKIHDLLG